MTTALVYLGGSAFVLLLLSFFFGLEDRRGDRVFLKGLRGWIDTLFVSLGNTTAFFLKQFWTGFVRLLFHYGAHQLLKRVLRSLQGLEHRLEKLVRQNKAVARELGVERQRTHLDEIADYKQESALTTRERNKLLKQ
jgi:hypothetical protein